MNTLSPPNAERHAALDEIWTRPAGVLGWICSTNHKDIGRRYIVTAMSFFFFAGALALLMRLQLAVPRNHLLGPDLYNQFFTAHGTTMMFLFAIPIMEGIALYTIPLMIGTRNVAFPRLNAFGYFCYLASGILMVFSLLLNMSPDTGWFSYVPLAGPEFSPGKRVDVWSQVVSLSETAALVAAVEIIVTVFKQRAPGMALHRIPLYVWAMVVTAFMVLFAMPAVMLASTFLSMDRLANVNTQFFNPAEGGDALLYQHVFWFFGHPEVYIIFLPATGFVSTILPTFCGRPVFGYIAIVLSLLATGFIAFGLWVHHMFATPLPELGESFFSAASMMIAIPAGIQMFCWIATIWTGRPRFATPMLFACGFLVLFAMGGLTGVMLASVPFDLQAHDTYFVVAHFHYVLIGAAVFPLFGALYYWFPKWTGRLLDERLGKWNFWLFFAGFNIAFFPMHILGLHGMPRRVYTYGTETGWGNLNLLATAGALLIGVSAALFLVNVVRSLRHGRIADANPWNASTLEWATSSPPAAYNFFYLPSVKSPEPLWDEFTEQPVVTGLSEDHREVLTTTVLEAEPDHRYELAIDSVWPFLLSVVVGGCFTGVIFNAWALPIGAGLAFMVLAGWFWRGNEPRLVQKAVRMEEGGA